MKTFALQLDEQQVTIIMQALADVKYRVAAPVIENIAAQLAEQQSKENQREE